MNKEHAQIPAWIGSIFLHTLLLLLLLFWFALPPAEKGTPGERHAVGTITLQSSDSVRQPAETQTTSLYDDTDLLELQSERLASAVLADRPTTPILAPGQQGDSSPHVSTDVSTANELSDAFQAAANTGKNTGLGNPSGEVTVQLFGTSGQGTKFVYVFDRSGSMEGGRLQRAKSELIRSLNALEDSHQFNIIFYNHEFQPWRPGPARRLIYATPSEKQAAIRFIESILPEGGTQHYRPLLEAVAHRPDVIFFLTDGESYDDLNTGQLESVERANSRWGSGAQINVIQFGGGGWNERPSRSLEQLAKDNNGMYQFIQVPGL